MNKKRTDINWSSHVVTKIEHDGILIHKFAKPNTVCGSVIFINACGIMAVAGDYCNWIFCREFHPSSDGFVSDHYWCEKLKISSAQKPYDFDPKGTEKDIVERLGELELDDDDGREYLEDLVLHLDEGEERYLVYAYDNLPDGRDHEFIPHTKKLNVLLEVIFDAFDEICRRMPEVSNPPKETV